MQACGRSTSRRVVALLVPWVFLVVFATMYLNFLWPRMIAGSWLAIAVGTLVALVFLSFALAAITFSRDVFRGRYPSA